MCRDPKEESRLDFSGFDCFLISISLTFLKIYPSWQPGGSRRYCHLEGYVAGMDGMGGWVCACVWSSVLSCSLLEYAVASASTSSLLSTFLVRHCFSCISSTTHSTQTNSLADGMTSLCSCTLPRNMEMKCCMIPIPIHIWHVAQKCMLWYPCWFMLPIFALKRCNAFCQATTIRGGKCQESLGLWRCLLWTFLLDRFARSSYGMHVKTWWWWWWWLFRITARVWSWHPPFVWWFHVISFPLLPRERKSRQRCNGMRQEPGRWISSPPVWVQCSVCGHRQCIVPFAMSWNWVQAKLGTDNWHNVAWLNGIIPRKAFAEESRFSVGCCRWVTFSLHLCSSITHVLL